LKTYQVVYCDSKFWDDETRFWIAQEVAESKYKHDARRLFQLGVKATGKKPMTIITDGLPAYHDAYKKEFWTLKGPRTEHVNAIKLRGDMNNNKMERFNGEVRDKWVFSNFDDMRLIRTLFNSHSYNRTSLSRFSIRPK